MTFQDFHRNEHDQQIYLTLLVPILDGPDYSQALGVLALRIDPETYLYPFHQTLADAQPDGRDAAGPAGRQRRAVP